MKRGLLWSAGLTALLMLAACGGGGEGPDGPVDPPIDPPVDTRPGIGGSTGTPTGTAYSLPGGVTLTQPIKGVEYDCTPPEQRTPIYKGSGGTVKLCLEFTNTSNAPITVRLPPGIIFISQKIQTQNGILLQTVAVEVPANSKIYVNLFAYCLNKARAATRGEEDTYTVGPVTEDAQLKELNTLVENKTLPLLDDGTLQRAVWNITDGQGLTAEDRAAINRL